MDARDGDRLFGRLLVERHLASEEQVRQAFAEMDRLAAAGTPRPLGALLAEQGVLTPDQLSRVLAESAPRSDSHAALTPMVGGLDAAVTVVRLATMRPVPAAAAADTPFGRYTLQSILGAGGMGMVWRARDTRLDRTVALKQIRPEALDGPDALARFQREARLSAKLRHPNIVAVHDVGEEDGKHFLTMDLVEGRTLQADLQLRRAAKLVGDPAGLSDLSREVALLADVADAVAYAHSQGVIHRDLKPSNVLLDRDGRPYVMDFGLARETVAEEGEKKNVLTAAGEVLGTPIYMSPEQAAGDSGRVGPRVDVWALGVMLYEILTGRTPFEYAGTPWEVLRAAREVEPVRPRAHQAAAPAELEAVCLRALEKEIERRCPNAQAFADDLRRWLRGEPVEASAPSWAERLRRRVTRDRRVAAAIVSSALLILAIVATAWSMRTTSQEQSHALYENIRSEVESFETRVMTTIMTATVRNALAEQELGILDRTLAGKSKPGPARALRGTLLDLLDRPDEAEVEFDLACANAPESSVVWVLRGTHHLNRYRRSRSDPVTTQGATSVEFMPQPPETPRERRWKERGLADFTEAVHRTTPGGHADGAEMQLGRALVAICSGGSAGYEQALIELEGLDRPRAWELRGVALYYLVRFEASIDASTRALATWPYAVTAHNLRALARRAQGMSLCVALQDPAREYLGAIADLDEVIRRYPDAAGEYTFRGSTRLDLARARQDRCENFADDARLAVEDFDEALARSPDDIVALNNRAIAQLTYAISHWREKAELDRRLQSALNDCNAALKLDPDYASAWNTRCTIYMQFASGLADVGRKPADLWRQAIEDADEALLRRPSFLVARMNRCISVFMLARATSTQIDEAHQAYLQAFETLEEVLHQAPDFGLVQWAAKEIGKYLGQEAQSRGMIPRAWFQEAIALFTRSLDRNPDSARAHLMRGQIYDELGRAERGQGFDARDSFRHAIVDFDQVIAHVPDFPLCKFLRGVALLNLGLSQQAQEEDPSASFVAAETVLRAAAEQKEPLAWRDLGILFRVTHRFAESITAFQAYATTDPGRVPLAETEIVATREAEKIRELDAWARTLTQADAVVTQGDFAAARKLFEEGFRQLEAALAPMSAAERTKFLGDPRDGDRLAFAHYRLAQILTIASTGRVGPRDAPKPIAEDEAASLRNAAFRELRKTLELGPQWGARFAAAAQLEPLHADPRWAELLRDIGK